MQNRAGSAYSAGRKALETCVKGCKHTGSCVRVQPDQTQGQELAGSTYSPVANMNSSRGYRLDSVSVSLPPNNPHVCERLVTPHPLTHQRQPLSLAEQACPSPLPYYMLQVPMKPHQRKPSHNSRSAGSLTVSGNTQQAPMHTTLPVNVNPSLHYKSCGL